MVSLLASIAGAETAGGVKWTMPSGWKSEGSRPMRAATYRVAASAGDSEDGECGVFYFGAGQGGQLETVGGSVPAAGRQTFGKSRPRHLAEH